LSQFVGRRVRKLVTELADLPSLLDRVEHHSSKHERAYGVLAVLTKEVVTRVAVQHSGKILVLLLAGRGKGSCDRHKVHR
jgi:hypothetical protein